MIYMIGFVFLLVSVFQFVMTWRTFTHLKKDGDVSASPFIMLGLWGSLSFSIIFFTVAMSCFFVF